MCICCICLFPIMSTKLLISRNKVPSLPSHPDHYVLNPSNQGSIGITEIRQLKDWAYLKPFNKQSKYALLANFHTATHEAQNAILKLLEEPPTATHFLIHVNDPQNVLQTIVSRCEIIHHIDEIQGNEPFIQWSDSSSESSRQDDDLYTLFTSNPSFKELFTGTERISKLERTEVLNRIDALIVRIHEDSSLKSKPKAQILSLLLTTKELLMQNVNIRMALDNALLTVT